jgi:hypothetical protein
MLHSIKQRRLIPFVNFYVVDFLIDLRTTTLVNQYKYKTNILVSQLIHHFFYLSREKIISYLW